MSVGTFCRHRRPRRPRGGPARRSSRGRRMAGPWGCRQAAV